jgi:hypothetical protein
MTEQRNPNHASRGRAEPFMAVSYLRELDPAFRPGTSTPNLLFTARLACGFFEASATGSSARSAHARLLFRVRDAAEQGGGDQVVEDANVALGALLEGRGAPPMDRYIRLKGETLLRETDEDAERAAAIRSLRIENEDALYRAGAELCQQNGGDPDRVVWWHNGEHPEPWGDEAQASMDDAAKIVHAFLEASGKVLVDAKEYEALLKPAGRDVR